MKKLENLKGSARAPGHVLSQRLSTTWQAIQLGSAVRRARGLATSGVPSFRHGCTHLLTGPALPSPTGQARLTRTIRVRQGPGGKVMQVRADWPVGMLPGPEG